MRPLNGFRDFYPEEMAQRNHLFGTWRSVARRFGYVEYDGPPLESLELYTRKSGEEIVAQLYNFEDKGGRKVALRPEMTPTLARMIADRAGSLPKPIKWFSIPQLFRYERKQRGRLREHFQLNVDIIGEPGVLADAELLTIGIEIQRALGLSSEDVVARVNDRRLVAGALELLRVDPTRLGAVYAAIDKFRKVSADDFVEMLEKAGVPREGVDDLHQLCQGAVRFSEWFGDRLKTEDMETTRRAVEDFERYLALMAERGLGEFVEVDFSIVRGLAYYTGIVFELYDRKGELRAICGGGRYDDLVASLGGPDLPALGFGMGDVVLTELLKDRALLPEPPPRIEALVVSIGPELAAAARQVTDRLRQGNVRSETPFHPAALKKALRAADQAGARYAVILGPDEWKEGRVTVKTLATGEQEQVAVDGLPDWMASRTNETK